MSTPTMVAVQPNGGRRPAMFFVHGVGGDVVDAVTLSVALGGEYPLYAFQCRSRYDAVPPVTSVPEMAARYLEELRGVCSPRDAVIIGHSMGAAIALEMAQLAARAGSPPLTVVNLDDCLRPGPQVGATSPEWNRRWLVALLRDQCTSAGPPPLDDLLAMDRATLARVVLKYWQRCGACYAEAGPDYIERFMDTVQVNAAARQTYAATPYPHRSLLVVTEMHGIPQFPCRCGDVFPGATRAIVAGGHDDLWVEPGIDDLAALLRRELAAANVTASGQREGG